MRCNHVQRKRRAVWHSAALAALLWLGLSPGGVGDPAPAEELAPKSESVRKRTAAYVFDRAGLTLSDADATHIDQLNYSFALLENGAVSGKHWKSIDVFRSYVKKHPHILPVLSIGGWGADGFSQAAATPEGRARLVESTLALMNQHGFLGVDIDWEYPGSSAAGIAASTDDRKNYTLLLSELRTGLNELTAADGKQRLLAIALGADPSLIKNIDCAAIGGIVDQVNLMSYDLHTPRIASHHTPLFPTGDRYPLSADHAVRAYAAAGIPRSKIMLGSAFYGRVYQLKAANGEPLFAAATNSGAKTVTYRNIITNSAWKHGFDEQAKAAYATNGRSFLTYDSAESIRHKGAYAVQSGLMGLMCWEYGGDASGELLRAMRQGLDK
ncbi:MAG: glycosyl hydrolase family 18 protein [Clostridia bacterium]